MPWGVVVSAAVSACAQNSRAGRSEPVEPSIEQLVREHKARMAAMHNETMRSAKVGMVLLIALACALTYCGMQLAGLA